MKDLGARWRVEVTTVYYVDEADYSMEEIEGTDGYEALQNLRPDDATLEVTGLRKGDDEWTFTQACYPTVEYAVWGRGSEVLARCSTRIELEKALTRAAGLPARCEACFGDGRQFEMGSNVDCSECGGTGRQPAIERQQQCTGRLGERPSWMSPDQYDASGGPCRCVLDEGHGGAHACEHTQAEGAES